MDRHLYRLDSYRWDYDLLLDNELLFHKFLCMDRCILIYDKRDQMDIRCLQCTLVDNLVEHRCNQEGIHTMLAHHFPCIYY